MCPRITSSRFAQVQTPQMTRTGSTLPSSQVPLFCTVRTQLYPDIQHHDRYVYVPVTICHKLIARFTSSICRIVTVGLLVLDIRGSGPCCHKWYLSLIHLYWSYSQLDYNISEFLRSYMSLHTYSWDPIYLFTPQKTGRREEKNHLR